MKDIYIGLDLELTAIPTDEQEDAILDAFLAEGGIIAQSEGISSVCFSVEPERAWDLARTAARKLLEMGHKVQHIHIDADDILQDAA